MSLRTITTSLRLRLRLKFLIRLVPITVNLEPMATAMIKRLLYKIFSSPVVSKRYELRHALADLE